jgi:hypothetical protein
MATILTGTNLGLNNITVGIEDTAYLSEYFNITEFNPVFGAGKNLLIVNTTSLLSTSPNIHVQASDSAGNFLYVESAIIQNTVSDQQAYYYSFHVYDNLVSGPGKLTIVGKTISGTVVRWTSNIVISTTTETKSKVVFYNKPQLLVYPLITNVLSGFTDINPTVLSGSFYSMAVNPPKDFDITNNYDKTLLDYRIIDPSASFSIGQLNFPITLNVSSVKMYNTSITQSVSNTSSLLISNILNKHTLQLADPYVYQGNKIAEISSGTYQCSFNNINYDSSSFLTSSYATQSIDFAGDYRFVKNSYALIGYTNLDTFSGKINRHKLYKQDLSTAGGYQLVTDESFNNYELLVDITTPNKTFENLGTFYSQFHIDNFWFTSSNSFNLYNDNTNFINGMIISGSVNNNYIIAKPNSSYTNRNAGYIPYDSIQNFNFQGSAFDSNYLHFYPNSSYTLGLNAAFLNKALTNSASLDFYITSSSPFIQNEVGYTASLGVKVGSLSFSDYSTSTIYDSLQTFDFSFLNETFGALVIRTNNFNSAEIANLSISPTNTFGFSKDVYFSKYPFDVTKPNDIFSIDAELYDNDSILAYNDLYTVQYFDPSGSTTPISISSLGNTITATTLSASSLIVNGTSFLNGNVGGINVLSAAQITGSLDGTATNAISSSYAFFSTFALSSVFAVTASYISGSISNALSSSYALSASYASNGGSVGLTTGSTYPITSSWSNNSSTASYLLGSVTSASYAQTASYILNAISSSYALNSNSSSYALNGSISNNVLVSSTQSIVVQSPTQSYNSAFFDYVAFSASNMRAGTVKSCFLGNAITFNEFTTTDIGSTSQVTMSVAISSSYVQLVSTVPINQTWDIKTLSRYI